MKKSFISFIFVLCSAALFAWTSPVTIPNPGAARLIVVAQNAHNYFFDITNSYSESKTEAQLATKTTKMANAFVALNADIVALCEVQECDTILGMLVREMNNIAGGNTYTYIKDYSESTYTKVGFVYRKNKVEPYQSTVSATTQTAYKMRLRIQTFKEIATGEKFILSMNHFKAKVNSSDDGESQRIRNANDVINKLNSMKNSYDQDVLIMGDLNAYMGEQPIINLENAGYQEQLIRFDPLAYTYIYQGEEGILDHAMANSTMANQITGAYAYHINTAGGYNYKYSDHDGVIVGMRLGEKVTGCESVESSVPARKVLRDGQIYIEIEGILYTITGYPVRK